MAPALHSYCSHLASLCGVVGSVFVQQLLCQRFSHSEYNLSLCVLTEFVVRGYKMMFGKKKKNVTEDAKKAERLFKGLSLVGSKVSYIRKRKTLL